MTYTKVDLVCCRYCKGIGKTVHTDDGRFQVVCTGCGARPWSADSKRDIAERGWNFAMSIPVGGIVEGEPKRW